MRYKKIGNDDSKVSTLGIGTWGTGGENFGNIDFNESIRTMQEMIDHGVNLIDTAPVYGNGTAEKVVGQFLKTVDRSKLFVSTKFGLITDVYTRDNIHCNSYKNCMREIESSFKNLGTDYIDFYFVHWPDTTTPIAETMTALNFLKENGYIRNIGVSNFTKEQILEAQQYAQIDIQQTPFSMVNMEDVELIKWGYQNGIDCMSYGSLGAGILSGKIREKPNFDKNDIRATFYDFYQEPKFTKIQELLEILDVIGEKYNRPVPQVAINWSSQKEYIGTALVGVNHVERAKENCATFEWMLEDEDMQTIDEALQRLSIG